MLSGINIRQKILLGFLIPSICLGLLIFFSYSNLLLIEERIHALGQIDSVERSIMELRRQGKFFLFYGDQKTFDKVLQEVSQAESLMHRLEEGKIDARELELLAVLQNSLGRYRESIESTFAAQKKGERDLLGLKSTAHEFSMDLEEQALSLSESVRKRIAAISGGLRNQILLTAAAVGAAFLIMFWFIGDHVLKPLQVLEKTTTQIAEGNFTPVELSPTRDEIRQLQAAFNRMVTELKNRQEQLVQSQKLSSIGTLASGIAHQVNNPLNNISTSAQLLKESLEDASSPHDLKMLDNIEKETVRARDIVRGLLDFSRRSELNLRRVYLLSVVQTAIRLASARLPANIRISANIPPDLQLNLDPQRMAEALLNIILNGIQAIGDNDGFVRLSLTANAPDQKVILVIEDTGQGIPPEDLPHIFDPFFTRKPAGKGTGLGLSVGYGIIEECGGSISVDSRPGQGTRFFITLPLPDRA